MTVIDLHIPPSDLGSSLERPDPVLVQRAIEALREDRKHGVLVHCTHGQDRTGLIVGLYRLSEGWTKDAAYTEMRKHGYHPELIGLHETWEAATVSTATISTGVK